MLFSVNVQAVSLENNTRHTGCWGPLSWWYVVDFDCCRCLTIWIDQVRVWFCFLPTDLTEKFPFLLVFLSYTTKCSPILCTSLKVFSDTRFLLLKAWTKSWYKILLNVAPSYNWLRVASALKTVRQSRLNPEKKCAVWGGGGYCWEPSVFERKCCLPES